MQTVRLEKHSRQGGHSCEKDMPAQEQARCQPLEERLRFPQCFTSPYVNRRAEAELSVRT